MIGAGFMGSGIAESAARAGLPVILVESTPDALDRSRARIEESVDRAIRGGKLEEAEAGPLLERIDWTTQLDAVADRSIVVEAVFEDPAIKGPLFRQLDGLLGEDAVLASNTSSIPIAQLASWTAHPERVLGLHFFSPVPVMKLVEVVVGLDTDSEVVSRAEAFARALGKRPIRTKDRSGFIVNMLLVPYLMAAVRMYEEGFATRQDIDEGMQLGCGHPMGPLALCDSIGLDVLYAVCDSLYDEFKRPEYAPPPLLKRMVVSGHHGTAAAPGFYELPQEHRDFRDLVCRLATERVAPRAAEIDATDEYPWDIRELLAEHDVLALPFATEYGGTGPGTLMQQLAVEELAKASAAVALILMVQELGTLPVQLFGTKE